MLKASNGKYSEDQIKKAAVITGELGKLLDARVRHAMDMTLGRDAAGHSDNYENALKQFAEEMKEYRLFQHVPHRQVAGLPNFSRDKNIRSPDKFSRHLRNLSNKLDFWRLQLDRPIILQ